MGNMSTGTEIVNACIESSQHHAASAITEKIRGSYSEKLFHEFELQNLHQRRGMRHFYVIKLFQLKNHIALFMTYFHQCKKSSRHPNTSNIL